MNQDETKPQRQTASNPSGEPLASPQIGENKSLQGVTLNDKKAQIEQEFKEAQTERD